MSNHAVRQAKQPFSAENSCADFTPTPAKLETFSDEDLMAQLARGDANALSALFDRYQRMVLKVGLRILRDWGEAEDLLQEVFFRIYRVVEKFDSTKGSARAWIYQCAYNKSLERRRYLELRKVYNQEQISQLDEFDSYCVPNGANGLTSEEAAYLVQEGLRTLNRNQRATLELVCFQGLSLNEIARRTKRSFMSVRQHYYRGLRKLKEVLEYHPGP